MAVFHDKKQEGGSFSGQKAEGWQFLRNKNSRVAVFHDKKQEGGSFFAIKSRRVAVFMR